jgi:integrase
LPASAISYLRTRLQCGLSLAVPRPSIPPMQALLLFSLTYGAGARAQELPKMRVADLLGDDGCPADWVRFDASATKHHATRRAPMHDDIRRDLVAFRENFPDQEWVAFGPPRRGGTEPSRLTASALTSWFRACLREAGLGTYSIASGRKAFLEMERLAA